MAPVAIITGATTGIGASTAVELARDGFDVGLTWHEDDEEVQATAAEVRDLGRGVEIAQLDLADPASGADVVDRLAGTLGGVDVLVANAGTGGAGAFLETELSDWDHVLAVDLTGAFVCMQAAARRMVAQGRGGRLIAVTSVHEHVPLAGASAYCAAKGGLGLLVKTAALELAEHGITVNAVAPGEIATPMTGQHGTDPRGTERRGLPLGRPGHADEIAAVVAFLASDRASYVTGSSWIADGGLMLMAAQANQELA